ncbi:MAG: hypothetical protein M3O28_03320 [Actinomycetota bacterium]|nr:hypothetical protein [Actinomycetota bacterium]
MATAPTVALTPTLVPPPAPTSAASLDLSTPTDTSPALPAPVPSEAIIRADDRITGSGQTVLSIRRPTVTLNRVQSGIGVLLFEAACSAQVGDVRLGCAYELRSGPTSTVQLAGGERFGPAQSRRPVVVASHERFDRVALDLRQCQDVARLVIYAFSEGRRPLTWGGTLIVTTFGGAHIELPLEELGNAEVAVLMSVYNVAGEFVLRAEMEPIAGAIREACRTYGFDRISWLDDRTPVD